MLLPQSLEGVCSRLCTFTAVTSLPLTTPAVCQWRRRQNNNKTSSWTANKEQARGVRSYSMASKVGNDTEDVLTAVLSAGVSASVRSNDSGGAMAAGQEDEPATYAGCSVSGCILNIVNWKRPCRTTALFAAINSLFWWVWRSDFLLTFKNLCRKNVVE